MTLPTKKQNQKFFQSRHKVSPSLWTAL